VGVEDRSTVGAEEVENVTALADCSIDPSSLGRGTWLLYNYSEYDFTQKMGGYKRLCKFSFPPKVRRRNSRVENFSGRFILFIHFSFSRW
jgi:hypothetical protein